VKIDAWRAFLRSTNVWENRGRFEDPAQPLSKELPDLGVYLHWTLPSALTHGKAETNGDDPTFPLLPNRWIVVRLTSTAASTAPQTMSARVIDWIDPSSQPGDIKVNEP
jgi:hypothetical protein